jgi:hypothetical protein
LPTQPQWEKRVGSAFPKASVAVRLYVRRTSDLAQHSELHSVQLAGFRRVDWQVNKRLQGRIGHHTDASVSSSSSRRVPKLLTGSARVMLSEGNFRQRRFSSCIGRLDCGRSPSNGSANRRSPGLRAYRERSRGCAHTLRASSPHVVDFFLRLWFQADRGTDFSLSILWTRQTRSVHSLRCCGTDVHPRMGAGLLEAATVLP